MGVPICSVCGNPARGLVGRKVDCKDNRHKKCGDEATVVLGIVEGKSQKAALIAQGKEKAAARKEQTGRYRQGNHDSNTKPTVRGGYKGDRHANGVRQNGAARDK